MSPSAQISAYDRMCWPTGELERALERGTHRRELCAYLGTTEYELLRGLARAAARARVRAGLPKVYVLPGIMGSQLGRARAHGQPPDLLWLDPSDIVLGRLAEMRWRARGTLGTLGVIPYSYLPLKLRLRAAGFEVVLYDYDWRADLRALGKTLAARLQADPAAQIALIGHSMGGLLARAALAPPLAGASASRRVTRMIGLGTPHGGAMAAVQALRATYPVVCRLAAIDTRHDAATLCREVFHSFTSIYQLLPARSGKLDLLDARCWPQRGVQPDTALLAAARDFGAKLVAADARYVSIIGTGQRTVTAVARRGGQFQYQVSAAGDGTVAVARATLAGARDYYVRCEHSELPRSELVAAALVDLLRTGHTRRLPQQLVHARGRIALVSDSALHREFAQKIDWHALSAAERRRYLKRLSAPPAPYRAPRRTAAR
jgi:pimeloyl-ACP methyl ester carboxylesterase